MFFKHFSQDFLRAVELKCHAIRWIWKWTLEQNFSLRMTFKESWVHDANFRVCFQQSWDGVFISGELKETSTLKEANYETWLWTLLMEIEKPSSARLWSKL